MYCEVPIIEQSKSFQASICGMFILFQHVKSQHLFEESETGTLIIYVLMPPPHFNPTLCHFELGTSDFRNTKISSQSPEVTCWQLGDDCRNHNCFDSVEIERSRAKEASMQNSKSLSTTVRYKWE